MQVADFDFELPEERIAQRPLKDRDASRLLVVPEVGNGVRHHRFSDLVDILKPGDLLVLNDTRVIPARLHGRKASGGRLEVLLLEATEGDAWRCLLNVSRKPLPGSELDFGHGLFAQVRERRGAEWILAFHASDGTVAEALARAGKAPLPPYIHRLPDDERASLDQDRYQTVFAHNDGAVAAPTAGLHFTNALLERLSGAGVQTTFLTLHVGPGTFLPVREDRVEDHDMHTERFVLPPEAARAVAQTRSRGGRVVAVGTTAARTLEHRARGDGCVEAGSGTTRLFIYPGYQFRVVDVLITNFHLPRSTLLMLVSAFAGRERVLEAYRQAVEDGYRFYSYGDAMLLTRRATCFR